MQCAPSAAEQRLHRLAEDQRQFSALLSALRDEDAADASDDEGAESQKKAEDGPARAANPPTASSAAAGTVAATSGGLAPATSAKSAEDAELDAEEAALLLKLASVYKERERLALSVSAMDKESKMVDEHAHRVWTAMQDLGVRPAARVP